MSTRKMVRETERALEREGIVVLEVWTGKASSHLRLLVSDREGRQAKLTMGCSPSCEEHAIRATVRMARNLLKTKGRAP